MFRLYCGTSGWNYNHWREVFYPKGISQREWLVHYAQHFDTVEINNSFYRLPEKNTFEQWYEQTPPGFTFAVKASRYLTHMRKLKDPADPLDLLLSRSAGLKEKRGPILYQLPPYWHLDLERLECFLKLLQGEGGTPLLRSVFEFRDDTWQCDKVWLLLEQYGAGYCIMDSPGLPLHLNTTSDFSYIRMHSGGEDTEGNYTDDHLTVWARHVETLLKRGDVYIYFNNDYKGFAVSNALKLRGMILANRE